MYNYAATGSIFDGLSNIYLLSTATIILAVIVAFYCSIFLKANTQQSSKQQDTFGDERREVHKLLGELSQTRRSNDGDEEEDEDDQNEFDNDDGTNNEQGQGYNESSDAESNEINSSDEDSDIDMDRDGGLVGKLKSARLKELEAQLTLDQLEEERRIEREQLAAIFELLKKQEEELNMKEIDETELTAQLNLYR